MTVAVAPKAAQVPSTMLRIRAQTVSKTDVFRSRMVPPSVTLSGMTLLTSPPCTMVTESTAWAGVRIRVRVRVRVRVKVRVRVRVRVRASERCSAPNASDCIIASIDCIII